MSEIEQLKKEAREEVKEKVLSVANTNTTVSWSFIEGVFDKYIDIAYQAGKDDKFSESVDVIKEAVLAERTRIYDEVLEMRISYGKGEERPYEKGVNETVKKVMIALGATKDERGVWSLTTTVKKIVKGEGK